MANETTVNKPEPVKSILASHNDRLAKAKADGAAALKKSKSDREESEKQEVLLSIEKDKALKAINAPVDDEPSKSVHIKAGKGGLGGEPK